MNKRRTGGGDLSAMLQDRTYLLCTEGYEVEKQISTPKHLAGHIYIWMPKDADYDLVGAYLPRESCRWSAHT